MQLAWVRGCTHIQFSACGQLTSEDAAQGPASHFFVQFTAFSPHTYIPYHVAEVSVCICRRCLPYQEKLMSLNVRGEHVLGMHVVRLCRREKVPTSWVGISGTQNCKILPHGSVSDILCFYCLLVLLFCIGLELGYERAPLYIGYDRREDEIRDTQYCKISLRWSDSLSFFSLGRDCSPLLIWLCCSQAMCCYVSRIRKPLSFFACIMGSKTHCPASSHWKET